MSLQTAVNWIVRRLSDAGALLTFVACLWFRAEISGNFQTAAWNIGNFYTAVFDWAAIQTGFLFGVYTYIVSKTAGFTEAIRGTDPYKQMVLFIKNIFYLVFSLTVLSVPLLIVVPIPDAHLSWKTVLFAMWCALVVFTFFSFIRIVRAFAAIEGVSRVGK